ncbi:unnamed protein product [Gadus morhua 'NCC']
MIKTQQCFATGYTGSCSQWAEQQTVYWWFNKLGGLDARSTKQQCCYTLSTVLFLYAPSVRISVQYGV